MKKIIFFVCSVFAVGAVIMLWPQESKAECQTYEKGTVLHQTSVAGLAHKYFGADRLLLFVSISGEDDLPDVLKRDNVTKIAKEYLTERMLPCTGHEKVEVVEKFYDARLQEDNVLIAYVRLKHFYAIPKSENSIHEYRPETVVISGGYYRTPPYEKPLSKKPQILDEKINFLSLEQNQEAIKSQLAGFIKYVLRPDKRFESFK